MYLKHVLLAADALSFSGSTCPARLHVGEVCMRDEPEIVKELREAEKLGLLQSKIQTTYENLETKEQLSRGTQAEVTVFDERSRWKDVTEDIPFESSVKNLYKSIVELSPDGIVTVDLKGIVTSCNTAAMKMFGFSKDEIVGKPFTEIGVFKEKDIEKYLELFDSILVDEGGGALEIEFQRKDGSSFTGEVRIGLIKEKEETVGFQAIIRDVTEQRKAEEKLRESEERFRDLLETANDLIQSVDEKGRFIYVNRRWLKTLGYSDEEVRKMTLFDILRKDHIPHCMETFERVKNGESVEGVETVFVTKDGREIVVEGNVNGRFKDGRFISCQGIFRDITERKKMEEESRESKQRFEDVALSSADFIWEVDRNGRYTYASGRVKEILGYSPGELVGKTPFDLMPENEAERIKRIFEEIVSEKKPIVDLENWNLTKDGRRVCLLTNGVPILDEKGNFLGYRGVDKDITERKRVEEELKKAYNETETLLDAAADGIRIINRDFTVRKLNSTMAKLAGIEKDKAVGMKCYEMFGAEVCGTEKCSMRRVLKEKKSIHTESVRRRMDGKLVPCLHVATPIKDADGRIAGIIEDFRDVTEQKRIEQALIENEEKSRAISESAYDAIIMLDDNGNVSYWNKAAEKIFGYKANEVMGKNIHYLLAPTKYHKEYEKGFAIFKKTGKGNAVGKTLELTALRKGGREFIVELSLSAVKLNDRWYAIGIVRDISERKAIEEELEEKLKELETFYKVAVDRELRMIELKREVNELCKKCGEKPRYTIDKN